MAPVYVILAPESLAGIYATWPEVASRIKGVLGVKHQKAVSRDAAERLLAGTPETIEEGTHAFIDGNHLGGVGVVLVHRRTNGSTTTKEISSTVMAIYPEGIGLDDGRVVTAEEALGTIRNIAAELAAADLALASVRPGTALTLVFDYEGVGAWLEGRWKTKDPIVRALVGGMRHRIVRRSLRVTYRHQRGHQGDRLGLNEFIQLNRRADALATSGSLAPVVAQIQDDLAACLRCKTPEMACATCPSGVPSRT